MDQISLQMYQQVSLDTNIFLLDGDNPRSTMHSWYRFLALLSNETEKQCSVETEIDVLTAT